MNTPCHIAIGNRKIKIVRLSTECIYNNSSIANSNPYADTRNTF